ncbi:MAG: histidine phosphatase family protein [Anaerolineales bacterium]|nr:histidine phosphatase family protein [Anaerolineales bacterium]
MPVVLLVRHGENDYMVKKILAGRTPGVHLNDVGRSQAESVAEHLKNLPIKAIYSSPLERAWETAEPLARALNSEIVPRPDLLEVDYGEWQGQTYEWLQKQSEWDILHTTPALVRFPGGETLTEAKERVSDEISALCAMHAEKEMFVCFTHADLVRMVVVHYLDMQLELYNRLYIGPASVTVLEINEKSACLISMNYEFTFPPQMP